MRIRVAVEADALAITRVRTASWRAGYAGVMPGSVLDALPSEPSDGYRRFLAAPDPGHAVLVAEQGSRVTGFVMCGPYRRQPDSSPADTAEGGEIYAVYVDPGEWGGGTGRALMTVAIEELSHHGLLPVRLWVLVENPRARRFYERFGFTADGVTADYRPEPGTAVPEMRYRFDGNGSPARQQPGDPVAGEQQIGHEDHRETETPQG
ncbi:ribosomal protein S18 acetylase RimI-like enzyme [Stackebrandtia albiflava]|uniref:Ribosomal protein S18 acetylase RimI-like enzyme n=1 Tax=Stackebrandtia albiflava TaxID=406432 RepID=A0A562VEA0_9ACTN|nr:GNAT family N-acetyltransferase [Stackebrandtia albiflava]TWJ16188.1 ribosomal protein S18 acetylase RimI-like enzyme [Stackebrandtia albiflava]